MFVDKNVENLSIGKFKRKREKSANDPCKQKESEVIETVTLCFANGIVVFPVTNISTFRVTLSSFRLSCAVLPAHLF